MCLLASHTIYIGANNQEMGMLVSIFNLFIGIGSFICAFVIDKIEKTHIILVVDVLISVTSLILLPHIYIYSHMVLCWIVFGLSKSVIDCFVASYFYRIYHLNGATILAYAYLVANLWTALLPYAINIAHTITNTYTPAFYFASIIGIIACIFLIILPTPKPPNLMQTTNITKEQIIKDKSTKIPLPKSFRHQLSDKNLFKQSSFQEFIESSIVSNESDTNAIGFQKLVKNNSIPMTPLTPFDMATMVTKPIDKTLQFVNLSNNDKFIDSVVYLNKNKSIDDDTIHNLLNKKYLKRLNSKINMVMNKVDTIEEGIDEDNDTDDESIHTDDDMQLDNDIIVVKQSTMNSAKFIHNFVIVLAFLYLITNIGILYCIYFTHIINMNYRIINWIFIIFCISSDVCIKYWIKRCSNIYWCLFIWLCIW